MRLREGVFNYEQSGCEPLDPERIGSGVGIITRDEAESNIEGNEKMNISTGR